MTLLVGRSGHGLVMGNGVQCRVGRRREGTRWVQGRDQLGSRCGAKGTQDPILFLLSDLSSLAAEGGIFRGQSQCGSCPAPFAS